jgi:hypothetical protein
MSNPYALVQNGVVINVILWDGECDVDFGDGIEAVAATAQVAIGFTYDGKTFTDPNAPVLTLAEAQATQVAQNNLACHLAITAGFQSSALGQWYTYPSDLLNQQNLTASMVASLAPGIPATWVTPFMCGDSTGKWGMVYHTAAQIQKVHADSKAAIVQYLAKNSQLQLQVAAATTVADVQAVKW